MRFLHPEHDSHLELSLTDVFLVPGFFEGRSRTSVNIAPIDFPGGSHPIVSANMNAVTGKRMAETMARFGGIGVLPQDMEVHTLDRIVQHIKSAHPRFDTPLLVTPDATLRDVEGIIRKRAHDMAIVVDEETRLVGVITSADLRYRDQYTPASRIMTRTTVALSPTTTNREAFILMDEARVKSAPVVDSDNRVIGILTRDDSVRLDLLQPSLDQDGNLMVAAAVGINADVATTARHLIDIGVDLLVLDTAHGHQRQMLNAIKEARGAVGDDVVLVAGNVCTAEGTTALIEAGADIVKVNVGPGAMCTTRMQTGAGRPTFSAVLACANAAHSLGKHVWADGGVRAPRDIALYLAAGASRVMVGSVFCGTYESRVDIKVDRDGVPYKVNFGMASARAVSERTAGLDPYDRAKKGFFSEGISTSRVYMRPGHESAASLLIEMITGLQSALTYVGVNDISNFSTEAVVGVQTNSGFSEGKPLDTLGT